MTICNYCGKEFIDKKHPNRKYCSRDCSGKARKKNLIGKKFGRLTVLKEIKTKYKDKYYLCRCICGNEKIVRGTHLTANKIVSCGCYRDEKIRQSHITHNMSNSRIYSIYKDVIKRCKNKNTIAYKNYGDRGITVCQEWLDDFMNFYNWAMANGYNTTLTIDRIDVNGNYEPNNCRWITKSEQSSNTRKNHFLTFKGETKTISEWSRITKIDHRKICKRIIHYGWSVERTLTTP